MQQPADSCCTPAWLACLSGDDVPLDSADAGQAAAAADGALGGAATSASSAEPQTFSPSALPLAVWREDIWPMLEDRDRAALRSSCKAACALCNEVPVRQLALSGCFSGDAISHAQRFAARVAPQLERLGIYATDQPLEPWLAAAAGAAGDEGVPYSKLTALTVCGSYGCVRHTCGPTLRLLLQQLPCLHEAHFTFPGVVPAGLAEGLVACCPRLELMTLSLQGGLHSGGGPPAVVCATFHHLLACLEPCLLALGGLSHLTTFVCEFQPCQHLASTYATRAMAVRCLEAAASIGSLRRLSWDAPWSIGPKTQLTHWGKLSQLTALEFHRFHGGWASLGNLADCTALVSLDIPHVLLCPRLWVEVLAKLPLLERLITGQSSLWDEALPHLERLAHLKSTDAPLSASEAVLIISKLPSLRRFEAGLAIDIPDCDIHGLPAAWERMVAIDVALQGLADDCQVDAHVSFHDTAALAAYLDAAAPAEHAAHHRFRCVGRPLTVAYASDHGNEALMQVLCHSFADARRVSLVRVDFERVRGGVVAWLPRLVQPWREVVALRQCAGVEVEGARELARQLAHERANELVTGAALVQCKGELGELEECQEQHGGVKLFVRAREGLSREELTTFGYHC